MRSHPSVGRRRRAVLALLVTGAVAWVAPAGQAAPESAPGTSGPFREVARLPLLFAPQTDGNSTGRSGWLILNPVTRLGYQVFEHNVAAGPRTVLQSFDLDTLVPRRRLVLNGAPITSGVADVAGIQATQQSGDVVHAVDPEGGRLYLALSKMGGVNSPAQGVANVGFPPDGQRPLFRFVAIDEMALDRGEANVVSSFREPETQARLHHYWVMGMAVTREHVRQRGVGRLLVLFAQPHPAGQTNPVPFFDHTLTQWDPSALEFDAGDALTSDGEVGGDTPPQTQTVPSAGLPQRLDPCTGGPLAKTEGSGRGSYQWGLLATREAVWTACQGVNGGAAGVVRAALDPETGEFPTVARQEGFPLSQQISDVLVDTGGKRLLVRSWGGGQTWWVFDASARRFTGAISATPSDFNSLAAGVDAASGRFYQLTPDHVSKDTAGREIPVRGGLTYSDTRLDPAPPLENVDPAMAYTAVQAIRVDPVTRRVFVRRAHPVQHAMQEYPGVNATAAAPPEPFYRVLEDRLAEAEQPAAPDDSAFTTNTAEDPALTRASYLGAGSAYGTRALFVGGMQAAVPGTCGDDTELAVGQVRAAEVSDLATRADAASLDADDRTRDKFNTSRCGLGTETSFGKEGENLYRAVCVGDEKRGATAPPNKTLPRHVFRSEAACDHAHGRAEAFATGAFGLHPEAEAAQDGARARSSQVPAEHLQVGYSDSKVTVTREPGKGITVRVEAIARTIVVPGVGVIGAVRAEAVTTATGRKGGATATYHRTVCGVEFITVSFSDCKTEEEQDDLERMMNEDLRGRGGRVRFRDPDPVLLAGSASGYKAGVQRPAADQFEDTRVARDNSPALPAIELILYRGDSPTQPARQFLHLAGVQAGVSYGIACLYGQQPDGDCGRADEIGQDDGVVEVGPDDREEVAGVVTIHEPGEPVPVPGERIVQTRPLWRRIVEAPARFAADVLRLLFANPREFGLMAAVWALLYAPCWLGERRRSINALRARRAVLGGTG